MRLWPLLLASFMLNFIARARVYEPKNYFAETYREKAAAKSNSDRQSRHEQGDLDKHFPETGYYFDIKPPHWQPIDATFTAFWYA
jgi:hypothetical protein